RVAPAHERELLAVLVVEQVIVDRRAVLGPLVEVDALEPVLALLPLDGAERGGAPVEDAENLAHPVLAQPLLDEGVEDRLATTVDQRLTAVVAEDRHRLHVVAGRDLLLLDLHAPPRAQTVLQEDLLAAVERLLRV